MKGKDKKDLIRFVKFAGSSATSLILDNGVFNLCYRMLSIRIGAAAVLVSTIIGRVISSTVNFELNKAFVFDKVKSNQKAFVKYITLVIVQMFVSGICTTVIGNLLQVSDANLVTVIKLCVEGCLFVVNYFVQKFWVFKTTKDDDTD